MKVQNNIDFRKQSISEYLDKYKPLNEFTALYCIIINVTNRCNLSCSFCPQSNKDNLINEHDIMNDSVLDAIIHNTINFRGEFSISGFGEPTLHPRIDHIVQQLMQISKVRLVSNGSFPEILKKVRPSIIDISLYNEKLYQFYIENIKLFPSRIRLNPQFLSGNTFFNNKSGNVITVKNIPRHCCNIPLMKTLIDTNGDILLCCSDWKREKVYGNILVDDLYDIWINRMREDKMNLLQNRRDLCGICSRCNSPGNLYGDEFAEYWRKYYEEH